MTKITIKHDCQSNDGHPVRKGDRYDSDTWDAALGWFCLGIGKDGDWVAEQHCRTNERKPRKKADPFGGLLNLDQ